MRDELPMRQTLPDGAWESLTIPDESDSDEAQSMHDHAVVLWSTGRSAPAVDAWVSALAAPGPITLLRAERDTYLDLAYTFGALRQAQGYGSICDALPAAGPAEATYAAAFHPYLWFYMIDAAPLWRDSMREAPGDAFMTNWALFKISELPDILRHAERFAEQLEDAPDNSHIRFDLAHTLLHIGRKDEAIERLEYIAEHGAGPDRRRARRRIEKLPA